jgi:hypothetical protein
MTPHTVKSIAFYIRPDVDMIVNKVATHYGISRASAGAKLLEMGIAELGEEFTRSSMDHDVGLNKRVVQRLRKQL